MLVEKKISAKINYDVLRDLDKVLDSSNDEQQPGSSVGGAGYSSQLTSTTGALFAASSSSVNDKVTVNSANQMTSLRSRKRPLPSLPAIMMKYASIILLVPHLFLYYND